MNIKINNTTLELTSELFSKILAAQTIHELLEHLQPLCKEPIISLCIDDQEIDLNKLDTPSPLRAPLEKLSLAALINIQKILDPQSINTLSKATKILHDPARKQFFEQNITNQLIAANFQNEALWNLMVKEPFQAQLIHWLRHGDISPFLKFIDSRITTFEKNQFFLNWATHFGDLVATSYQNLQLSPEQLLLLVLSQSQLPTPAQKTQLEAILNSEQFRLTYDNLIESVRLTLLATHSDQSTLSNALKARTIVYVNLSGMTLNMEDRQTYTRVFMPENIKGVNFRKAKIVRASFYFQDNISEITFTETTFPRISIEGSNFSKANFSKSQLSHFTAHEDEDNHHPDFRETNFSEAIFPTYIDIPEEQPGDRSTPWSKSLNPPRVLGASFKNSNCTKANFRKASLKSASIEDVNFHQADFREADFSKAILINVDFTAADLRGASFQDARLSNVNFFLADLRETDLTVIQDHEKTLLEIKNKTLTLAKEFMLQPNLTIEILDQFAEAMRNGVLYHHRTLLGRFAFFISRGTSLPEHAEAFEKDYRTRREELLPSNQASTEQASSSSAPKPAGMN